MKAIREVKGSVLIDTKKGFNVWVDVWYEDGELFADWNKYIFYSDDEDDVKQKEFQEDSNNFMEATEEAIDFYMKINNNNKTI
jgi:hypothetical protein